MRPIFVSDTSVSYKHRSHQDISYHRLQSIYEMHIMLKQDTEHRWFRSDITAGRDMPSARFHIISRTIQG